jgi:hypothetical protein
MSKQFEIDLESLEQDLSNGFMSVREFNEEVRDMERSYRDELKNSADEAYDREMGR